MKVVSNKAAIHVGLCAVVMSELVYREKKSLYEREDGSEVLFKPSITTLTYWYMNPILKFCLFVVGVPIALAAYVVIFALWLLTTLTGICLKPCLPSSRFDFD